MILSHRAAAGPVARLTAVSLTAAAIALTGCSGGSNTDCDLDGCTVSFPRDGTSAVSVLGVSAELLEVDADTVTIDVAGETVTAPVGQEARVEGFVVAVERVTDDQVVVRVRR